METWPFGEGRVLSVENEYGRCLCSGRYINVPQNRFILRCGWTDYMFVTSFFYPVATGDVLTPRLVLPNGQEFHLSLDHLPFPHVEYDDKRALSIHMERTLRLIRRHEDRGLLLSMMSRDDFLYKLRKLSMKTLPTNETSEMNIYVKWLLSTAMEIWKVDYEMRPLRLLGLSLAEIKSCYGNYRGMFRHVMDNPYRVETISFRRCRAIRRLQGKQQFDSPEETHGLVTRITHYLCDLHSWDFVYFDEVRGLYDNPGCYLLQESLIQEMGYDESDTGWIADLPILTPMPQLDFTAYSLVLSGDKIYTSMTWFELELERDRRKQRIVDGIYILPYGIPACTLKIAAHVPPP